jgi:hypothetical protein
MSTSVAFARVASYVAVERVRAFGHDFSRQLPLHPLTRHPGEGRDPVNGQRDGSCGCGLIYGHCGKSLRSAACLGPGRLRCAPRAGMTGKERGRAACAITCCAMGPRDLGLRRGRFRPRMTPVGWRGRGLGRCAPSPHCLQWGEGWGEGQHPHGAGIPRDAFQRAARSGRVCAFTSSCPSRTLLPLTLTLSPYGALARLRGEGMFGAPRNGR